MTNTPPFQRLVRFVDKEGKEQYRVVPLDIQISQVESSSTPVTVITGDVESGFSRTSNTAVVNKVIFSLCVVPLSHQLLQLLCPVTQVPIVSCIGLNYREHAAEVQVGIRSFWSPNKLTSYLDKCARLPPQSSSNHQTLS